MDTSVPSARRAITRHDPQTPWPRQPTLVTSVKPASQIASMIDREERDVTVRPRHGS